MSNRSAQIKAWKFANHEPDSGRREIMMLSPTVCSADARVDGDVAIDSRFLDQSPPPQTRRSWYIPIKAALEWIAALVLLVVVSPLLCILAALVKLTSAGPALYTQTRLGLRGRMYRICKLRTMRHDAEAHSGPVWAAKDDVRVTSLGRFLRASHLDELPQLWNVLRGDMALIGPRPERPEIAARVATRVHGFYHRLRVRPGITGLAQMLLPADDPGDNNYRGVRHKLAHDLLYVRELSPMLDLRILAGTWCYFIGGRIGRLRRKILHPHSIPLDIEPQIVSAALAEESEVNVNAA
jgi:lipopolysaccharide/colanic/teichoic acid biosynthesis glycosyltransferase